MHLHNNAPVYTNILVSQSVLVDPLHLPDVAPADFMLHMKVKSALKGDRFEDVTSMQANVTAILITDLFNAFQSLYECE